MVGIHRDSRSLERCWTGYDERQMVVRREFITDGTQEIALRAIFADDAVRYVMVRDAQAGCYDFRVERGAR